MLTNNQQSSAPQSSKTVSAFFADTFLLRLRGLLFRPELHPEDAIWIKPANSIHTFGMRYPIDIVFLAADQTVIKVVNQAQPGRVVMCKNARSALEFRNLANTQHTFAVGEPLDIQPTSSLRHV